MLQTRFVSIIEEGAVRVSEGFNNLRGLGIAPFRDAAPDFVEIGAAEL